MSSVSPATLHGGQLGRYFEELCRIKVSPLRSVAASNGLRLQSGQIPKHGGIYAFWWVGDPSLLRSASCNRDMILKGPGGRDISLTIDDDWLGIDTRLPLPLYVGKTADDISTRIGLHLKLGSKRILKLGKGARKAKAPTTSCQLRAGIEHFFPNEADTRTLILDNVGLSCVVLDGDNDVVNRFYLEDLAIGLMRPPFNVDSER